MRSPGSSLDRQPAPGNHISGWDSIEQSVSKRFEICVERYHDHIAVKDEAGTWTYDQLNRLANRIAWELLKTGGEQSRPVALLFNPGAEAVASMLAVLKSGKFYVPLDPLYPQARNQYIFRDSQARVLLTSNQNLSLANELFGDDLVIVNIDDIGNKKPDENPGLEISPTSLAYLIYTSGSTGQPKGVVQNQRGMLHNTMRQTELLRFGPGDRNTMLYSTSVMGTVRDLSNSLLNGGALYPFDIRNRGLNTLVEWLQAEKITICHTIPSVFRHLPNVLQESQRLLSVRLVILGGEMALSNDLEIFKRHFSPDCILFTGLGTTETGTVRQIMLRKDAVINSATLPLGYPIRDVEVILLDDDGKRVQDGEIGEIAVRSSYLALGYWNKPEITREAFLPDPLDGNQRIFRTGDLGKMSPDGSLFHCGRKDFQIKIRGFRIETQEIESAILESGSVTDAVVVGHIVKEGESRLVAYIIPAPGRTNDTETLQNFLATKLPDYMIPVLFITLDTLPTTPNGKVDREALPPPNFSTETALDGLPQNPVQEELIQVWKEILSVHPIGIHDDFFELGGDSLSAVVMVAEIEKRFGKHYPIALLLENRTIEKIAKVLNTPSSGLTRSRVAIKPEGHKLPLFVLPGGHGDALYFRNLAPYLEDSRPLYGFQSMTSNLIHNDYYHIENIAVRYLEEILEVQPKGPYYLAGHSFGGYVALEIARSLLIRGEKVAFLGLFDTYPPGPRQQAPFYTRLIIHYRNLQGLGGMQRIQYFKNLVNEAVIRTAKLKPIRTVLARLGYIPPNPLSAAHLARYVYNPRPFPGKVTLFKTDQNPWYVRWDPMEKWPAYVNGEFDVRKVPGEHGNMLFEPYVRELAQQLNDCLRLSD